MNPSYRLQIDLYLRQPVEADSILMRRIGYLPFVPRDGDTIRFTDEEDDGSTVDLTLDEVVWDSAGGQFVCCITDESCVESYSNGEGSGSKELVEYYSAFDFIRLNYPVGQVVKGE